MNFLVNEFVKRFANTRYKRLQSQRNTPIDIHENTLIKIITANYKTKYLSDFSINQNSNYQDFTKKIPLVHYEDISNKIEAMMLGEANVLVPNKVTWFSKSSGTSNAKSKYIPVTKNYMKKCYTATNWDVVSVMYNHNPNYKIFSNKNLIMGGTLAPFDKNPRTQIGDVSAIMLENMPFFAKWCYTPDFNTALMHDWDKKLELMVEKCTKENVVLFAGVPTWILVLFNKMIEAKQADNMLDIWPDASIFLHGGIGFEPYRSQFEKLFPKKDFCYLETYNASEGFFAFQDDPDVDGMLLMLDNCNYYEFIPLNESDKTHPNVVSLKEVKKGDLYEIVITTLAGLYRYRIGDIVRFVSIKPYRIKIAGRTKQFINVFGEELMIHNVETALKNTCQELAVEIGDYTVAPIFMKNKNNGKHEWLIELKKGNCDEASFGVLLDNHLQKINSDYEAKRSGNHIISLPKINIIPLGTIEKWQRKNNRYGGQSKVPRLSNERRIIEEILEMIKS